MDTQKITSVSLETIPAERQLINELAAGQFISGKAREFALNLLYPVKNWGLWISRLLTALGSSLVLAGVVYFFAFNWSKISPIIKLGSLQAAILACLATSFCCGISTRLSGKMLLLSASLLVGVFLAVFGQIYQTGADAYNLFLMWSLLILPWTLISEFAALWALWLVVTNTFFILWWTQTSSNVHDKEIIHSLLALFNGLFLALRESQSGKRIGWLENTWTRNILILPILVFISIPTISFITYPSHANQGVAIGVFLSAVIHSLFFIIYRFVLRDMWALAATVLSLCLMAEFSMIKLMSEIFEVNDAFMYLLMGAATIAIFTFAIVRLRMIARDLGEMHV